MSLLYRNGSGVEYPVAGLGGGGSGSDVSSKQNIILDTPLTIGGSSRTTVESALGALNTAKANVEQLPYTYIVNSNATLLAWVNNTSGNDYTSVYIDTGSFTVGSTPLAVDCSTTGTKRIFGNGESSIIINLQIQNGKNISNIKLQNGTFYSCMLIRDVWLSWNETTLIQDVSSNFSNWTINGSWLYAFSSCSDISNCRVIKTYDNTNSAFPEIGCLYDCGRVDSLNEYYMKDGSYYDVWNFIENDEPYDIYGESTAPAVYNSSYISNSVFNHIGHSGMGIVNNCAFIENSQIYGYVSEYGIIANSSYIVNCRASGWTRTFDSGGAGHLTYCLYGNS